eukprot:1342956-Amorphochlora_amoeboformis.AAC.2
MYICVHVIYVYEPADNTYVRHVNKSAVSSYDNRVHVPVNIHIRIAGAHSRSDFCVRLSNSDVSVRGCLEWNSCLIDV